MSSKYCGPLLMGLVTLGLSVTVARAQSLEIDSNLTDLSDYLLDHHRPIPDQSHPSGRTGQNDSTIVQSGRGNQAGVDLKGFGNTTTQSQTGMGNSSAIAVTGDLNAVTTTQVGNNDRVNLNVLGQGNTVMQTQIGNNLSYSLSQTGNAKSITVQQFGSK